MWIENIDAIPKSYLNWWITSPATSSRSKGESPCISPRSWWTTRQRGSIPVTVVPWDLPTCPGCESLFSPRATEKGEENTYKTPVRWGARPWRTNGPRQNESWKRRPVSPPQWCRASHPRVASGGRCVRSQRRSSVRSSARRWTRRSHRCSSPSRMGTPIPRRCPRSTPARSNWVGPRLRRQPRRCTDYPSRRHFSWAPYRQRTRYLRCVPYGRGGARARSLRGGGGCTTRSRLGRYPSLNPP